MRLLTIIVAAMGTAHHIPRPPVVYLHGQRLERRHDPAYDTCSRQWSYTRPRSLKILARYEGCWRELDNWTRSSLTIWWAERRSG